MTWAANWTASSTRTCTAAGARGYVLSLALAGLLGWLLSRKVMEPVVRLARQVRHRDQLLDLAPPLAPDYAHDEVGELAEAFDYAIGQLHQVLTREKLFTSDVSHELRTPLMVIATSSELLAEEPGLSPKARTQLARITTASEEMRDLVQTFLMLARSRTKELDIAPRAGLQRIADDLAGQWRGPIEAKGLQLIYEVRGVPPEEYNAAFLRSVMSNLLRNAMHYTDAGHIRLQLTDSGFVVEDSGQGIPEEQRERMFQPFVRGPQQRGEGLGLGLSLVKRICAAEGWEVGLTPAQPHGAGPAVRRRSLLADAGREGQPGDHRRGQFRRHDRRGLRRPAGGGCQTRATFADFGVRHRFAGQRRRQHFQHAPDAPHR